MGSIFVIGEEAHVVADEFMRVSADVNVIGQNAFYGLHQLKTIIIPDTVRIIGSNAFFGGVMILLFMLKQNQSRQVGQTIGMVVVPSFGDSPERKSLMCLKRAVMIALSL